MTEEEKKNAKVTDKVESALQRAIHITKLLIIWAARSFLYSGCTFCVFLIFHFVYGKASSNELVEVGALVCGIVWPALLENDSVDKMHSALKQWLVGSFFIFSVNYVLVYRSAFIGVPLSSKEETTFAFLIVVFGISSLILSAVVSIYKEVHSV